MEHQDETPWQSLIARLVEVVLEARAWAGRGAGSPPSST
ncbi:hypothetical protein GGE06_008119 [Streptomyces sp. SFB5A]|uniref:Uncharacterized protein n=1 Tax=Streptomyces nymphaeiformis TaxID=2663842 RepID=A0A7W7UAD4_9ACTN|nr:hypothetical protein [Streptomyces nymphaeiformis]